MAGLVPAIHVFAFARPFNVDARDKREHDGSENNDHHENKKAPRRTAGLFSERSSKRMKRSVLGRPGSDLLFQALRLSTIGAEEFDGRVRDGIGYRLLAMTTRSAKNGTMKQSSVFRVHEERC